MSFFLVAELTIGWYISDLHWREGVVDRPKWFIYFSTLVIWLGLSHFMFQKDIPHVFPHSQVKQRHLSQTISSFPHFFTHFMIQKHLISSDSSVKELFGRWSLGHQVSMGCCEKPPKRSALDIEVLWSSTKMDLYWQRWQRQKSWQTTNGQVKYSKYVH